jgi:hypothetical protein
VCVCVIFVCVCVIFVCVCVFLFVGPSVYVCMRPCMRVANHNIITNEI